MLLYLIRHAHALEGDDDALRPLSARGKKQVRRLASFLDRCPDFAAREIWHSPLVRARETARLLTQRLHVRVGRKVVAGLEPEDNPSVLARRLARRNQPLTLVGHEPHLSSLTSLLVTGRDTPQIVALRKSAVLALERDGRTWKINWLASPEIFPNQP